jgi:hypothetical protein
MNPSRTFILRPVATSLLTAGILLAGMVAYLQLPISALPQVDYPTIQILTFYPGASPDVMASSVTAPLERQFGQVPGLIQMTSTSAFGSSVITLQFDLNLDIDVAEQEVQAAINAGGSLLPADLPAPPVNAKVNPGARERPGNRVDENCDQVIAPFVRVTTTFPFAWRPAGCAHCVQFTKLRALNVPAGATLRVTCRGRCHFTKKVRRSRKDRDRVNLLRRVGKRQLRSRSVLEIRATVPGEIGSVKQLRVITKRNGRVDVSDRNLCLTPRAKHPARHCAAIR